MTETHKDEIAVSLLVKVRGSIGGRDVRSLQPAIDAVIKGAEDCLLTYALKLPLTTPVTFTWEVRAQSNLPIKRTRREPVGRLQARKQDDA